MRVFLGAASTALLLGLFAGASNDAAAAIIDLTIDGSDAIYLAGRTDLVIPDASAAWPGGLLRHGGPTPEEIQETLPPTIGVAAGDIIRLLDPADGGISFFNGGAPFYGPSGGAGTTNLSSFGGISSFFSDGAGPLVGVFLSDAIPNGAAPVGLDFTGTGLGTDFLILSPGIGQVFFIGDGMTSTNVFQQFIAPAGATRLAFGIPDGFGFVGAPGAYDDNDGAYRVRIGVNELPTPAVPEPSTMLLLGGGFLALAAMRRRKTS